MRLAKGIIYRKPLFSRPSHEVQVLARPHFPLDRHCCETRAHRLEVFTNPAAFQGEFGGTFEHSVSAVTPRGCVHLPRCVKPPPKTVETVGITASRLLQDLDTERGSAAASNGTTRRPRRRRDGGLPRNRLQAVTALCREGETGLWTAAAGRTGAPPRGGADRTPHRAATATPQAGPRPDRLPARPGSLDGAPGALPPEAQPACRGWCPTDRAIAATREIARELVHVAGQEAAGRIPKVQAVAGHGGGNNGRHGHSGVDYA